MDSLFIFRHCIFGTISRDSSESMIYLGGGAEEGGSSFNSFGVLPGSQGIINILMIFLYLGHFKGFFYYVTVYFCGFL